MSKEIALITNLGYEYEFDGKAKGIALSQYGIKDASVKGSVGVGALGIRYIPTATPDLTIDLKGHSYFGKHEGAGGLLQLSYAF